MSRQTRRAVLAALGVGLGSAGCLADPDDLVGESTTTGDWFERASNSPNPDHAITLENDAAEPRTLRVEVVREATGEAVFETTAELSPGAETTVYNLRQADPEGVETFRVCAELVGPGVTAAAAGSRTETDSPRRDCATIDTSECYGDAYPTVSEDRTVQLIYAIC